MSDGDRSPAGGREWLIENWVGDVGRGRGGCLVIEDEGQAAALDVALASIRTIVVRASSDERLLAYAALAEICAPLLPLIPQLPAVQAAALSGALALGPAGGDSMAVAAGFRSLLHVAAERAPLVVRVDEAHLLDQSSAAALAYAARRLDAVAVGVVITQDPRHPQRLELSDASRLTPGGEPGAAGGRAVRRHDRTTLRPVRDVAAEVEVHAAETVPAPVAEAPQVETQLDSARAWLDSGHPDRALAVADAARTGEADDVQAARAELLLGRIEAVRGHGRRSAEHLHAAAELAAGDAPVLAASAQLLLVSPAVNDGRSRDAKQALSAARRHLAAAGADPEADQLRRFADAATTAVELADGRTRDLEPLVAVATDPGMDLPSAADLSLLVTTVALPLIWQERIDEAGALLDRVITSLRERGAIGALALPLCTLAVGERRAGRPARSIVLASEARDLAEKTGNRAAVLFAYAEIANAYSLFGDVDRTRAAARVLLGPGGPRRGILRRSALSATATVELMSGNPAAVIELLEPLVSGDEKLSPMVALFHSNLVAAYVAMGRTDEAIPLVRVLESAAPPTDGRLQDAVGRARMLVAYAADRDRRFAEAVERGGRNESARSLTRLYYARRLLDDGRTEEATAILRELASQSDENQLGAARGARLSLARLGLSTMGGDPAWIDLGAIELGVALAAAERVPALDLADRFHMSPPEVERVRDDVLVAVGARSGPAVRAGLLRPQDTIEPARPRFEIRLLGGLAVFVGGVPCDLPTGAASTAVSLLALRRAVHVEELTETLWPDSSPDIGRRRLRNVLARVRAACGSLLVRIGERIELDDDATVDHHVLESRARSALASADGPLRLAALEALVADDVGALLPEAQYEDWCDAARHRTAARRVELLRALGAARDAAGDAAGARAARDAADELIELW